jgi:4-oxalocrotonate tautomerase
MPFIEVKMWEGRSKEQRALLIRELTQTVCDCIGCPPAAVQITIDEYPKSHWGLNGHPADEEK